MRYLLDTNIFVYLALDNDMLSRDVYDIINDPENLFYMSAESVRELIVAYWNKQLGIKRWKTAEEMVEIRCRGSERSRGGVRLVSV